LQKYLNAKVTHGYIEYQSTVSAPQTNHKCIVR
jgi:hypothetical protein